LAATFTYIWEYIVKAERLDDFRFTYGPRGKWVELFSRAEGYVKTDLHRDLNDPSRFLTVDYWASKKARDQFQDQYSSEFAILDKACETLTIE